MDGDLSALMNVLASGSLGTVLGVWGWKLWATLVELRHYYEGDPKDPSKPGRMKQEQLASQAREDSIRAYYEEQLKQERIEFKAVTRELNATVKELMAPEE